MILNNYTVPDKEFDISMNFRFEAEHISGQTSASDTVTQGISPKSFTVTLQINFDEKKLLTELLAVAEARDSNGAMIVYDIVDETANTVKVRQVEFTDQFSARKVEKLNAWRVHFVVTEKHSVAEKVEQQQQQANTEEQSADGQAAPVNQSAVAVDTLTGFEKFLTNIEDILS